MGFSAGIFVHKWNGILKLKEKVTDFKTVTRTRRAIHLTMITTYSLKRNAYSAHVQSVVIAEDLFQPEDL